MNIEIINQLNNNKMKNLILTTLLSFATLLSTAQVHVVAPNGHTGVGTDTPTENWTSTVL